MEWTNERPALEGFYWVRMADQYDGEFHTVAARIWRNEHDDGTSMLVVDCPLLPTGYPLHKHGFANDAFVDALFAGPIGTPPALPAGREDQELEIYSPEVLVDDPQPGDGLPFERDEHYPF